MKQTAVEWLVEQLTEIHPKAFEKAKAMEKEQIIDAFFEGKNDGVFMERYSDYKHISPEEYYNETYLQSYTPKHYRVWFPDTIEAIGGYWWNAVTDSFGRLYDPKHPIEDRDTVQWYIENGYKVEEVING